MSAPIVVLDARGLEPPEPMIRILEALASLPKDSDLQALTDRRPVHLYPLLEQRGYQAETQPAPDRGFVTRIRHRS